MLSDDLDDALEPRSPGSVNALIAAQWLAVQQSMRYRAAMNTRSFSRMTPQEFSAWRKRHDLTQAEAAHRLGLSKRSIYGYETAGLIPITVQMACKVVSAELEGREVGDLDFLQILREQHPEMLSSILVIPRKTIRGPTYATLFESLKLTSEVTEWLTKHTPSARYSIKTVVTPSYLRIDVPVLEFERDEDAFFFKMVWQ